MKTILALVLCFCLAFTTACPLQQQWINIAIQDLPIVLQIVTNILNILVAAGNQNIDPAVLAKVQTIGAEVQKDLTLVQGLASQYQQATALDKPAIANKIDDALKVVEKNLTDVLSMIHIKNQATQVAIVAGLSLAVSTVEAIMSLIPQPLTGKKMARVPHKPLSPKQLKKAFNSAVAAFPAQQIH